MESETSGEECGGLGEGGGSEVYSSLWYFWKRI